MNFSHLSPAEKLIFGCGIALLILSFMPWFAVGAAASLRQKAWSNLISALGVIAGILMVLQIAVSRFGTGKLPVPKLPWGRVHLVLGVFALVMVLAQALMGGTVTTPALPGLPAVEIQLERRPSLILGVLAAFGLAYGGFARSKEPESAGGSGYY